MNEEEILRRLTNKLAEIPLFDRAYATRKFLESCGLIELIEAGAEMRYDEWGDIPMTYGPAKHWDDALAKFTDAIAKD